MILINNIFDPETIDIAESYVLEVTNESKFYKEYKDNLGSRVNVDAGYSQAFGSFNSVYFSYKRKVTQKDSSYFLKLVKNLLWQHYAEQFCDRDYINKMLKTYPIRVKLHSDDSSTNELNEIQDHLDKAQQHLKNVENQMNTLTQFADQVSATVHLIHGRPAADYTESELMGLIRKAQDNQRAISDLVDTSDRMKKKHESYAEDIKVYVAALDALS